LFLFFCLKSNFSLKSNIRVMFNCSSRAGLDRLSVPSSQLQVKTQILVQKPILFFSTHQ
jgi:hypothetical protein